MSEKNFVAYGDAESILTGYANRIKQSPTTFVGTQAQWNALSSSQKAEYELVDITDDSLSPSGHVDWESNGKLGAKNLLPYNLQTLRNHNVGGTWNGNACTLNGVTFTVNDDLSIKVNGTANERTFFNLYGYGSYSSEIANELKGKIMSCTNATSDCSLMTDASNDGTTWASDIRCSGEDIVLPDYPYYGSIWINVNDSATISNLTVYPMIRLATDSDSTYQPYSMTNKQITPYVQAISNPNLFDNPWFTVNQRGITNDWTTQFAYGVDRWRKQTSANNTLQITDNGISATTNSTIGIYQVFKQADVKDLYGRILTFSVMYGDGTIESGSGLLPLDHYLPSSTKQKQFLSNTTKCNYVQTESYSNGNLNIVVNTKAGTTIKAAKLELGSVSTLAMDTAPNYQQELAKCQRYFVRYKPANAFAWIGFGVGQNSATDLQAMMDIPVPMRVKPSISFNNIRLWNHSYAADVSSINVSEQCQNKLYLYITPDSSTAIPAAAPVVIWLNHNYGDYIDISADL